MIFYRRKRPYILSSLTFLRSRTFLANIPATTVSWPVTFPACKPSLETPQVRGGAIGGKWQWLDVSNVRITRPLHIRQQRIGASHIVLDSRYQSGAIMDRGSPQTYRYVFCMARTSQHVSVHWQHGEFQLWVKSSMCWMPGWIVDPKVTRAMALVVFF